MFPKVILIPLKVMVTCMKTRLISIESQPKKVVVVFVIVVVIFDVVGLFVGLVVVVVVVIIFGH